MEPTQTTEPAAEFARNRLVETVRVLLVEDNPADARLTREALKESKIHVDLAIVDDGIKAVKFLRQEGVYDGQRQPDIVLLDLNLPRMDGREVLREIKNDNALKHIPIVVLTTSEAEEDIFNSYSLHANCFITKPLGLEAFLKVVTEIEDFWLSLVKLPGRT